MSDQPSVTPRPRRHRRLRLTELLGSAADIDGAIGTAPDTAVGSVVVGGVTADSRLVQAGDLYVGLPGASTHGARFAAAAVAAGAVAVLTDRAGRELAGPVEVPVVVVDEPRSQLADLAVAVYDAPATRLTMLGLTGTNGKTTTSYLTEVALRSAGVRTGIIGTLGFTLDGRPLPGVRTTITTPEAPELQALLAVMLEQGAEAVVMEVSSHALALGRTDGIVFDAAGFTNLGSDHLDFHGDLESYFEAKARLFTTEHCRRAVLNVDDARGRQLLERAQATGLPSTTVSLDGPADYALGAPRTEDQRSGPSDEPIARTPDGEIRLPVPLPGSYNLRNALTALALAGSVGVPAERAAAGIAGAVVPGRMQVVPLGTSAPTAIVDFAHTPQAVEAALTALAGRRRIVVLGSGGDRDPGKRGPMGAAATAAEVVVVTDDNPRREDPAVIRRAVLTGARAAAGPGHEVLDGGDRRAAIRLALQRARPDDVVAVLGKGHESGQEVGGEILPFDDVVVLGQEWAALRAEESRS